ncbi:protein of unknown function [Azospirillum lipoferum 4B]|uniref:Uncharacterized protein n=1 Tax=Azospirillum lipoferum (strain 4B) TaxID=862719 RepID=G7Z7S8_AZOL4|nr:protein of unknown function [Azospirillum lipoferum 4B]
MVIQSFSDEVSDCSASCWNFVLLTPPTINSFDVSFFEYHLNHLRGSCLSPLISFHVNSQPIVISQSILMTRNRQCDCDILLNVEVSMLLGLSSAYEQAKNHGRPNCAVDNQ